MILGILSDTHGRADRAAAAVDRLTRAGAEALVHCGDVGGERVFDVLAGLRAWFVWGNCDVATPRLCGYLRSIGLPPPECVPLVLDLADRRIAVLHGHEPEFHRLDGAAFDYVLHGHTHARRDERVGGARIINPGALHRAREYSVASLDLVRDVLTFHVVGATEHVT